MDLSLQTIENHYLVSAELKKKHNTSMSCTPKTAIQSCDTGQGIPFGDSCQLTNIKFNTDCGLQASKCDISHSLTCGGRGGGVGDVHTNDFITTKFLGCIDNQIFSLMVLCCTIIVKKENKGSCI